MYYPLELILTMKQRFMMQNLKPKDITFYFDLDNTLCLFSVHGKEKEALESMYQPGFYENLEMLDDGIKVIPVLQAIGFKVKILTSCIDSEYCKPEKINWVKKFLPFFKEEDIILCENGVSKTTYVDNIEQSILVDDYGKNLMQWIEAGGYAIKKSYSNKKRNIDSVKNHVEIFKILYDLKVLS